MMLSVGAGCPACFNLGYKGRVGIFELLTMTPKLRSIVMQRPSLDVILNQALEDGMQTLLADGIRKMKAGIITLPELIRTVL